MNDEDDDEGGCGEKEERNDEWMHVCRSFYLTNKKAFFMAAKFIYLCSHDHVITNQEEDDNDDDADFDSLSSSVFLSCLVFVAA